MLAAAFDEAIPDLQQLSPEDYKEAAKIMEILREKLPLWIQCE